jgi:hypothetical protein
VPTVTSSISLLVLRSLPCNGSPCHIALFKAIHSEWPIGVPPFFSERCACDVCDWPRLPSTCLCSHGDYSPTAPADPTLKPLVASGYLVRCELVQMYHHHLCSLPRALLLTPLVSFRYNVQALTFLNAMEIPTARFTTSSRRVYLTVLLNALSHPRHSCCFRPRQFIPLLHSGSFRHLFSIVGLLWRRPLRWAVPARRSSVIGQRPTSSGTHHRPGSVSAAVRASCHYMPVPISVFQCNLFFTDVLELRYSVRIFPIGLQLLGVHFLQPSFEDIHCGLFQAELCLF